MIRNAVCALRRTPVGSLRQATTTTTGQLVRHPLPAPQSHIASSSLARGLHGVAAGSGLLRAHTVPLLPGMSPAAASVAAARRLNTTAGGSTGSSSVEETKSALLNSMLDFEDHNKAAVAPAARNNEDSFEHRMERETREREAARARKAAKKAKVEEMMALISRQAAAGVAPDREALLLARSARADLEIEQLKEDVTSLKAGLGFVYCMGIVFLVCSIVT